VQSGKIRTIVRDPKFEEELRAIEADVHRADEFVMGAETILSRFPESGFPIEGSQVWFICGHTVDAAIYYAFDSDHVYFLSIEKAKLPEL
jgi:hypothetical protein